MTRVVHCTKASFDIYIGRPNPSHSKFSKGSIFANPYKIGVDGTRKEVLEKYEQYLRNNEELMARIMELDGKVLGCWCKPAACHGDVIIKIINELKIENKFILF